MADELSMAVAEVLRKGGVEQDEWLREGVRVLSQALTEMVLEVPRVRDAACYPRMAGRQAERAVTAVVQEAFAQGVSPRRVEHLARAFGMRGLSKSQIGRLCAQLGEQVERFRTRRLEGSYTNVWLDGEFVKVHKGGRVVSQAIVIAVGVTSDGVRELLGLGVGPTESGAFWLAFVRGLMARGLQPGNVAK